MAATPEPPITYGEAKTTATKEMEVAQQMMAKNDIEACKSNIHSAMEATEK